MSTAIDQATICAPATPPGRGGVGIVRISGPLATQIATVICGKLPAPRQAHYCEFRDAQQGVMDQGICLYFPAPHSFTGEDVVELQGHGGPMIIDMILREAIHLGARLARPGEFSERAFLNDKIDLAQAEAIADLIDSSSEQAARSALRSLAGEFSRLIDALADEITRLRIYVEAAIDFPEEEVDFLADGEVARQLVTLQQRLQQILQQAQQGSLLQEGLNVVIAGEPNAGKSSLMNALAGQETAIVTAIAGTTRDMLRERIHIDGLPLHLTDTAGLRDSEDPVEQEGIRRAWQAIGKADLVLLVVDASLGKDYRQSDLWQPLLAGMQDTSRLIILNNKIDLAGRQEGSLVEDRDGMIHIHISAKQNIGMDILKNTLKQKAGFRGSQEGGFLARRRHLQALEKTQTFLQAADQQLRENQAGELVAEDLREAHNALAEITGKVTADELLGKIFSSFCIGK